MQRICCTAVRLDRKTEQTPMKRKIPICVKHILWYTSFANGRSSATNLVQIS